VIGEPIPKIRFHGWPIRETATRPIGIEILLGLERTLDLDAVVPKVAAKEALDKDFFCEPFDINKGQFEKF
jgi:hypothetical protein